MLRRNLVQLLAIMAGVAVFSPAISRANTLTASFTGSDTSVSPHLAAEVDFSLTGSTLTVTLTNTATQAATDNSNVLTAVFWSDSTAIGGTLSDVEMGTGSILVPSGSTAGEAGLFGYASNSGDKNGSYVVSSTGLDINFTNPLLGLGGVPENGTNSPPDSPDGPPGGLIPTINGSNPGGNQSPFIENSLVYTVSGVSITSLAGIDDVVFQYGTASSDTTFGGLPSPAPGPTLPLPAPFASGSVLLGILGLVHVVRKRVCQN
jgi:hypothetical protein